LLGRGEKVSPPGKDFAMSISRNCAWAKKFLESRGLKKKEKKRLKSSGALKKLRKKQNRGNTTGGKPGFLLPIEINEVLGKRWGEHPPGVVMKGP